jgi:transposase InsO family protein
MALKFQSAFHLHLLDQGVEHHYIRPRTPRLNGKVERSHRIDAEEFYRLLDGVILDDTKLFDDKLQEWAGLLQLPSSSWRTPRTNSLRAFERKNQLNHHNQPRHHC